MDGWLPAQRAAVGTYGPLAIGYYTRNDIPFHYALADAFTICDNYHCSVMGPTWPNRLHAMTARSTRPGRTAARTRDECASPQWRLHLDDLRRAAPGCGDQLAQLPVACLRGRPGTRVVQAVPDRARGSPLYENGMKLRSKTRGHGRHPQRQPPPGLWVQPEADEHPSGLPAAGAEYMYDLLDALASTPEVWNKTVLFITYDENGGFFDHVTPPTPPPGTPGEYLTATLPSQAGGIAGPIGLGFRVPTFVISPWSQGGWVASETFDHTSLLRFLESRFGVREPNISAWRRQTVGDLTSTLRFPRRDVPFPELPDPAPLVTKEQQEVATLPAPSVPSPQSVPHQEPGTRPHL